VADVPEPRDGDFVAYLEALQRESAARLARPAAAAETAPTAKAGDPFFERAPKDMKRNPIEQAVDRIVRGEADAALVKSLVAAVVGLVFLLAWLGNGGLLSLLIAAALFAYAVPRLVRTLRVLTRATDNRNAIEEVFGRPSNGRGGKR
jgi:Flp pilus assembly protein TadB